MFEQEPQLRRWRAAGFIADHFALTAQHGWTYEQYRSLMILESTERIVEHRGLDVPYNTALEEWINSGIPARRALIYREARFSVTVARDLEERRNAGEPIDPAMATLLALRRPPGAPAT